VPAPTLARAGTSIDAAVYTDASAHCSFAPDVADSLVATAVWCRRDLTSRQGSCGPIPVFPGSLFTPPQTVTKTFEPLTRASEDQTMPVDASPIGHPHSSALDLRPPLLSRWPHFWLAASSITPLDDDLRRYPGQAHADASGEVWVRRPLPLDVRPM